MMLLNALCCVLLLTLNVVQGFYLPGVNPREYVPHEEVTLKVNSMKSIKTAIPYDFYSLDLHCKPEGDVTNYPESLGEILWGDDIKASPFEAKMIDDISCKQLCTKKIESKAEVKSLRKLQARINNEYRGHLILDNLPVAEVYVWDKGEEQQSQLYYRRGYPLGIAGNATSPVRVYNHLSFTIKYHKPVDQSKPAKDAAWADVMDQSTATKPDGYRIVSFGVMPYSVESSVIQQKCKAGSAWEPWTYQQQELKLGNKKDSKTHIKSLTWSYSIKWEEDPDLPWASRWNHILKSTESADAAVHWFSITNSLLVVLLLSAMVAGILLRLLHKDFNRYNNPDNEYESQEETGWKMIHGDVFRPPSSPRMLAVYVGSGTQLLGMAVITILFACLGVLSPANRGALVTAMLLLYVVMGILGGYTTARLSKMWGTRSWTTVILTGTYMPGAAFLVFLCMNIVMWAKHAANAVSFITLFALLGLWLCVTVPLSIVGAVVGFRQGAIEPPVRVNPLPKHIPPQPWFLKGWVVVPVTGLVPFMAAFIEIYFILSSLWLNAIYYVFGFFAVVFMILIVTCAETSIVGTYFQLCFEDYHWWWRSYQLTGSCGMWMFIYSIYYFWSFLQFPMFWSAVMYFGYMGMLSYIFGILTGAVGFLAAFLFTRIIYAQVKVD
eukprot:TRINITY_DN1503_c0_g1_i1.p1 TRINITY_DN1503_c0_g1~~TRINITY_DN1503_c0_g1_i1.p1  ORF type:complete len:664 (-),score=80.37 TRINITY_DN1503_c0_g1_i1:117-2108(-)